MTARKLSQNGNGWTKHEQVSDLVEKMMAPVKADVAEIKTDVKGLVLAEAMRRSAEDTRKSLEAKTWKKLAAIAGLVQTGVLTARGDLLMAAPALVCLESLQLIAI